MLDEIIEYNEYQFDNYNIKDKSRRFRLRQRYLNDNLTAVPRALEIIARKNLFDEPPKDTDAVRTIMVEWLNNFKDEEILDFVGIGEAKRTDFEKKLKNLLARYEDDKSSLDIKLSGCKRKTNINDYNVSYWDRTIASALERGPLKRYMLVENEDLFDNIYKKDRGSKEKILTKDHNHKDYILKFTAYYLLENRLNQNSVYLSPPHVFNWSIQAAGVQHYWKLPDGTKKELFEKHHGSIEEHKYYAYEPWISNFEIVDITAPGALEAWTRNPQNKGKHYYIDKGAEPLECHVAG